MNKKLDQGNIIYFKTCKINKKDNFETIKIKMIKIIEKKITIILNKIKKNNIKKIKQNDQKSTYAKKFNDKKNYQINWNNKSSTIKNKIKAFSSQNNAFTIIKKTIIKIIKIKILKTKKIYKPGIIIASTKKNIKISSKNDLIIIQEIKIQNKKKLKINDIINGYKHLFKETIVLE